MMKVSAGSSLKFKKPSTPIVGPAIVILLAIVLIVGPIQAGRDGVIQGFDRHHGRVLSCDVVQGWREHAQHSRVDARHNDIIGQLQQISHRLVSFHQEAVQGPQRLSRAL